MLSRLKKLAGVSAHLRSASLHKEAGLIGSMGKAIYNKAGGLGIAMGGLSLAAGAAGARGTYRQNKAGFVQSPTPPGT